MGLEVGKCVVSRVEVIGFMRGSFVFPCVGSKEHAGTRTAKLRQEKEVQDRHLQADVEALKNLEENLRQLTDRDQQLAAQVRWFGRVAARTRSMHEIWEWC